MVPLKQKGGRHLQNDCHLTCLKPPVPEPTKISSALAVVNSLLPVEKRGCGQQDVVIDQ